MTDPTRVVLVDDHPVVREGLVAVLAREPDLQVVGSAGDGNETLGLVEELMPDVAVVDYHLPDMSGADVCAAIGERHPSVAVVVFTALLTDEVVRRSLAAGARAYVYKDADGEDLKRAIRAVGRGEVMFDRRVAGIVRDMARWVGPPEWPLSAREHDVLSLVATGATNREIADVLHVTTGTVRTHLKRLNTKLGVHTRTDAVRAARAKGLLWSQ